MTKTKLAAALLLVLVASAVADDEKVLKTDDKAGLTAAIGQKATVEGTVAKAEWSRSGKVMNMTFTGEPNFIVAVFQKNKEKLDAAFNGDLAKTVTGATVRVTGKLAKYGGRDEKYTDAAQINITMPTQLTVLSSTSQPTTQPATKPTE